MSKSTDMTTKEEYLKGRCEVCGFYTFKNTERDSFEICEVCFWEDDGFNDNPDEVRGGPNQDLSLNQARANFKQFGAYSQHAAQYTRRPHEDELQP
jgi:hypothetical protein